MLLTGTHVTLRNNSLSPLRYAGSKRKMLPAIRQLIVDNVPRPQLFVEPFCGGASVSLGLLEADAVERVVLADLDPLVGAFWEAATRDTDQLIKAMRREPVTVENWDRFRNYRPTSTLRRALKCLFLNRTTFSGIIGGNAGPIGGRSQANYRIDARFDKDSIAERIHNVGRLYRSGRILGAFTSGWQDTLRRVSDVAAVEGLSSEARLAYLDPPYVKKAGRLYARSFALPDHKALAAHLAGDSRWILSYDAEPPILDLYRGQAGVHEYRVAHHYTMTGTRQAPAPGREVLFTNLPQRPHRAQVRSGPGRSRVGS